MSDFQYKRPPITEAVVELICDPLPSLKIRKKALKKLEKNYENYKPVPLKNVTVEISSTGEAKTKAKDFVREQFSSDNMTQQLIINGNSIVIAQLAPYTGWENFRARIIRDWDTWQKEVNVQTIQQIGMRYINRIDVPISESSLNYKDYVTIYPSTSGLLDPCGQYSVNLNTTLKDIDSTLILKTALVESPLPNHKSIVIDIDIIHRYNKRPDDKELYEIIDQARKKKNEVFETCITNKARELFNQ